MARSSLLRPWLLVVLCLLCAGLAGTVRGQEDETAFTARVTAWQATLDKSASVLVRGNLAETDYEQLRATLTEVFDQARAAGFEAKETVATTRQMLDALGPPPAEDAETTEAEPVTKERTRLNGSLSRFDGHLRQADLIATRADILLRTANERRLGHFTETLFRRSVSPLAPETWVQLPVQVQFTGDRIARARLMVTMANLRWEMRLYELLGLTALALALGWMLRLRLRARFGQHAVADTPSYHRRVGAVLAETAARALTPALLTAAVAFVALDTLEGLQLVSVLRTLVRVTAGGLIGFLVAAALGRALLAPDCPAWRLCTLDDAAARALACRVVPAAALVAGAGTMLAFLELTLVAPELHAVASFLAKLTGALGLLLLLPGRLWRRPSEPADNTAAEAAAPDTGEAPAPRSAGPRLRLGVAATALVVIGLSLLRYHNLGTYIAELLLAGTAVAGPLLVLRGLGQEGIALFAGRRSGRLGRLRRTLFHTERGLKASQAVAAGLLDLALLFAGFGLLLPSSGIKWSEVHGWITTFLRGVTIGEITIAPLDILSALLLAVVGMAITRIVQRLLDERVLQRLQIDIGVRHSIRTGVGYLGVTIAMVVGIGALGLNLSNVAMIASALSVGIGFGLQSVVANFVAGLVLLVERPIKVGDWVVVGGKEGIVKRISVRATEIQTFQRASIIVPNSELISTAVINWTYKDKLTRIEIPVGVAYDSDLDRVRAVLLACAAAEPRLACQPEPVVVLRNFGASSLDLELRCFVPDVDLILAVSSDLRFAIFKAFRQHGIEIPFAQQVVHLAPRPAPTLAGPAGQEREHETVAAE